MRAWRWSNVPLPEEHLVLLVAGIALHACRPRKLGLTTAVRAVAGTVSIAIGAGLATWATVAAGQVRLTQPDQLVTDGPYRLLRHPMYVGWSVIYCGIGIAADSGWPFVISPVLAALVDGKIRREERRLATAFGASHASYCAKVRRY